jgi:predicted GH43/DUF377 family glycosyl hydrolase
MSEVQFTRLGIVLKPESDKTHHIAKFNAGMIKDNDIVHMVFRYSKWRDDFDPSYQSNYEIDETRYAKLSLDGVLLYESTTPLLAPSLPWDVSGCQDARIVEFEGWYYLTYCGWDIDKAPAGCDTPRMGFARTKDFLSIEKLGVVNHYTSDKDHYIFPERINGKIALVHRIVPNIQIEYFDTIENMVDTKFWENYTEEDTELSTVLRAEYPWECGKVGGSVPPIKTDKGWIFIYHGVQDFTDSPFIYRVGLALLDLDNPSKVIARLPYPVLEPEEDYELIGDVNNVVFPVGGFVHNDELFISYGGADRVVALAKANLSDILDALMQHKID